MSTLMDADNRANRHRFKIDDEVRMSGNLDLSIDAAIAQEQNDAPATNGRRLASRRIRIGTYLYGDAERQNSAAINSGEWKIWAFPWRAKDITHWRDVEPPKDAA